MARETFTGGPFWPLCFKLLSAWPISSSVLPRVEAYEFFLLQLELLKPFVFLREEASVADMFGTTHTQ